ncbi:hypothetical protein Cgig2_027991 [Carnegiea gigantea]|uniref:DUF4283 domain-containing protein n=1 Tax=Carnegiea gigantea TaxID=171969 RepID=A0A9Q1JL78_9CARY|nr:hypothetical protein Cgig2_027991 [Carnegiea gigantea]
MMHQLIRGKIFKHQKARKHIKCMFWSLNPMDLQRKNVKSLPIWVQLPDLDIKFWGSDSLSKIGSTLRFPLKTDKYTNHIEFFNEDGVLVRQQVHYKWKPIKCAHYKMFGHEETSCRKKGGVRIEWRPVQKDSSEPPANSFEDFTQIPKRSVAKQPLLHIEGPTTPVLGNPFLALELSEDGGLNWPNKQEDLKTFLHINKVSTNKKFYITFVYGMNHDQQRQQMWDDLKAISQQMTEAWCILGDFNAVLHKEDRRGGNAI